MKPFRTIGLVCILALTFSQISFSQSSPSAEQPTIYVNPDWDKIAEDLQEALKASDEELEKLRKKYDPNVTPEEDPVPQEILDMLNSYENLLKVTREIEKLADQNDPQADDYYTDEEWEQIEKNIEEAQAESWPELERIQKRNDPNYNPDDEVPQEILDMLDSYQKLLDATKEVEKIHKNSVRVTSKGTGQTTGHIATLSVNNKTNNPIDILPEQFYIPSGGKYQSYVGRIPEGHTVPPRTTMAIPVEGYCADVHTPPVPLGEVMPPLDTWIIIGQPSVPEPMNPPGASGAPQVPEPMNPPGPTKGAPQVPEPMNPPGGIAPPREGIPVKLLPRDPVPSFTPDMIPKIPVTPSEDIERPLIITFPGTDIPTGGTIDPKSNPPTYGAILVKTIIELEEAYDVIRETENFPTPYFSDPNREREAVIQQTFWIYTAALTGDDYEKEDFEIKVYDQFETKTGRPVGALVKEQKEQIDEGIADFWNTFQATGVEAKIISVDSPDLIDPDMILATVSSPKCKCNNIAYDLEIKRAGVVVHSDSHTSRKSPTVKIKDFKYGDVLKVKISNISANCACNDAECEFYPAESTNSDSPGYTETDTSRPGKVDIEMDSDPAGEIGSKGNNNCQSKDMSWNDDSSEYSFTMETKDEKTNSKSVFQRLRIKSYCQLDDCIRALCAKTIQLNFVTAK